MNASNSWRQSGHGATCCSTISDAAGGGECPPQGAVGCPTFPNAAPRD